MLTITSPYVQIADLNGDPLDDGSIYIGTAGLNAETNPITVYWDAAGTQPAAQPLSTRSGVIARNGAPARVYINAASYSLMVRDKQGRLIASELTISSSVDASAIADGTIAEVKLDSALVSKINGFLPKTGGTMTGAITLPGNATNALEAVPLQQLQSSIGDKIIPVGASVSASSLTATLLPSSIDFRSSTLSVGAPVTRTNLSAASINVPSGATLGTSNGVLSRLLIVALDNAGTIELGITNLSGGMVLDETGVINTTAISASANSASVVYSNSSLTNVAYRLVGFIESTQTTAGIWTSSPSKVQGAGGQALADLRGIGGPQTWQSVLGSRLFGTTYTNTTGRSIVVSVWGQTTSSTTSMTTTVNGVTIGQQGTSFSGITLTSVFVVPPGATYSVSVSNNSLQGWTELR